ncbi:MAG: flagellar basal body L-ring protein FlgH [Phycisphaerales bacterium]|nr:MAG: flagellar basal body L-ring protein FlgH [Phycisphaerales bacterium]
MEQTILKRFYVGCLSVLLAMMFAGEIAGDTPPSSSLLISTPAHPAETRGVEAEQSHALRQMSMFAIAPPEPRRFQKHDLIQIIVREQSQARSRQQLDLDKEFNIDGKIARWPAFSLPELLALQLDGGRTNNLPELSLDLEKEFSGDGDYRRRDDLTARVTAEVIQVLPNGNMVIEARTHIKLDDEESIIKVTGTCRPEDVTATNTILSNQIHNLRIEKVHKGELKKTNEKGIISKVFDAIFAF